MPVKTKASSLAYKKVVGLILGLIFLCAFVNNKAHARPGSLKIMPDVYQKVKPLLVFIWDGERVDPRLILSSNPPGARGTGFIVTTAVLTPQKKKAVKLSIVTANHVISGLNSVLIKFSRPDTVALMLLDQPVLLDESVDLALIPVPDGKASEFRSQNMVLKPNFVCRDIHEMELLQLHEGTKVFSAGYLTGINSPAMLPFYRFGQYSSVNIGTIKLKDWKSPQNADWICMSGSKGMSGSPVFLDTKNSTNDLRLVGVLKDVYDTVEDTTIRQQDLMLAEPARNLSRLLERYHKILERQGYTIQ